MRPRTLLTLAIFAALVTEATQAHATEQEWHFGIAYGYALLVTDGEETLETDPEGQPIDTSTASHGTGGLLTVRYGLNDALDLTMEANVFGYPDTDQVSMGTGLGLSYVVDIMRWVPTVGVSVGAVDVVVVACLEDEAECGHDVHPAITIPAGLEFRVTDTFAVGAHLRYAFLLLEPTMSQLFVGAYASVTP